MPSSPCTFTMVIGSGHSDSSSSTSSRTPGHGSERRSPVPCSNLVRVCRVEELPERCTHGHFERGHTRTAEQAACCTRRCTQLRQCIGATARATAIGMQGGTVGLPASVCRQPCKHLWLQKVGGAGRIQQACKALWRCRIIQCCVCKAGRNALKPLGQLAAVNLTTAVEAAARHTWRGGGSQGVSGSTGMCVCACVCERKSTGTRTRECLRVHRH